MTMTANPRAPWTVGSTPPPGGMPSSPSPYKGEENDGPSFRVPRLWSAQRSMLMSDYATLIRPTQNLKRRDSSLRSE